MRPVAEWRSILSNQQESHTKPASREACCRAAVKPGQAACPATLLRAYGAQSGVQGVTPCEACQTREPRGPSPSGGKTPAKQHVSRVPCAPMARSPGCRDTAPAKPARPASRGTRRATAVKPRPSRMSRYAPCPPSAGSPGSRGTAPWGRGGSSRMSLRPKCSRKRSVVA